MPPWLRASMGHVAIAIKYCELLQWILHRWQTIGSTAHEALRRILMPITRPDRPKEPFFKSSVWPDRESNPSANLRGTPFIQVYHFAGVNVLVQAVCWCNQVLFTCLNLWNWKTYCSLATLQEKKRNEQRYHFFLKIGCSLVHVVNPDSTVLYSFYSQRPQQKKFFRNLYVT